jgi:organic radical activating enzyme
MAGQVRLRRQLCDHVAAMWRRPEGDPRLVVCTGGEPLLDAALIAALHARGFDIAVETNGTVAARKRDSTGSTSAPRPIHPVVQTSGSQ